MRQVLSENKAAADKNLKKIEKKCEEMKLEMWQIQQGLIEDFDSKFDELKEYVEKKSKPRIEPQLVEPMGVNLQDIIEDEESKQRELDQQEVSSKNKDISDDQMNSHKQKSGFSTSSDDETEIGIEKA